MRKIGPLLKTTLATAVALTSTAHSQTLFPIDVPNGDFEVPRGDRPDGLAEGEDVYMDTTLQSWHQYDINTNGGPQRYWNPSTTPNTGQRFADTGFGGVAPDGDHVGIAITRYNDDRHPDGTPLPAWVDSNDPSLGYKINPATGEPYPATYERPFEALCQVLEDVLFDPNETYRLTVAVGHGPGEATDPQHGAKSYEWNGYRVQLLAGGEEVNPAGSGLFAATVLATNGGTVIAEDDNSAVIAVNTFETITVTYTPADPVPPEIQALAGLPIQIRLSALENPLDHSTQSIVAFDSVTLEGPEQISGTDYATWAGGFGGFTDTTDTVDFDKGGLDSGIEYVVGGDPTDSSDDLGLAPSFSIDGTDLTFTFQRDQASIHPDTTVTIEVGTDLGVGFPDVYTVGEDTAGSTTGVTVDKDTSPGFDTVTLTVTMAPDTKKFARLNVAITAP